MRFLLFLLFITSTSFGQWASKYEEVKVTPINGDVFISRGRIYDVLELKDENKKKSKMPFNQIKMVDFYLLNKKKDIKDTLSLYTIKVSEKKYQLALKMYESEKILIYGVIVPGGGGASMNAGAVSVGNFSNFNYSNASAITQYYCYFKELDKLEVMYLYSSLKTFRIMASECFRTCKVLSEKINSKEFGKENIKEIGDFYTNLCN